MNHETTVPLRPDSLSEAHRAMGLPMPQHPLLSLVNGCQNQVVRMPPGTHILQFYKISFKPDFPGRLKYGQSYFDFDGGGLLFASPGQIIDPYESDANAEPEPRSLATLLIHPDFLWNHPLARKIKQYGFFSYATNEALHLSEDEKNTILSIFRMIETELDGRIDDFSQNVILSQIELLLNYADRFYKRQFITRKAANSDLLQKLEDLLDAHFSNTGLGEKGVPTVQSLASKLNLSPSYLSDMLRVATGQNAQQHIHAKLIEKAKEILSTTALSVSEVAYALGFEHPQSFSKLFRKKVEQSPLEFRRSFR